MENLPKIHVVHTITIKYCPVISDSFVLFHSFAVTFPLDNWKFLDVFHLSGLISHSERQWDKGQEHGESISIVKCVCVPTAGSCYFSSELQGCYLLWLALKISII